MKLKAAISFLLAAALLSGCSADTETSSGNFFNSSTHEHSNSSDPEYNVTYNYVSADYPAYKNAEELITSADMVLIGKVTGLSFQMLDSATGLPPTEKTEERHKELCTIYTVEVITPYKGVASKAINIRVRGGLKDAYTEQQLQALGEKASDGITVAEETPEIEIGETYLFSLRVFEGTDPCIMNPDQSVINLRESLAKDVYGYISAKDIISYFGEDKWSAFRSADFEAE